MDDFEVHPIGTAERLRALLELESATFSGPPMNDERRELCQRFFAAMRTALDATDPQQIQAALDSARATNAALAILDDRRDDPATEARIRAGECLPGE